MSLLLKRCVWMYALYAAVGVTQRAKTPARRSSEARHQPSLCADQLLVDEPAELSDR
jgi:hypothetical protein